MKVYAGQRPKRTQRSAKIIASLSDALQGTQVDRNIELPGKCDLYLQWGYRLTPALAHAMELSIPFCIVDGGFFADRDEYFSLSFNGFQNLADYIEPPRGVERPRPNLQQWRDEGDEIIIYGQVPTDRSLRGLDHATWVLETFQECRKLYPDKEVDFRPHPKAQRPPLPLPPMEADYDNMYLAVTYTSTAAVQTLVAGIPTVALHPASTAAPVASKVLSRIRMPGRVSWLYDLSHRQYRDTEIPAAVAYIRYAYPQTLDTAANRDYDVEGIRP